MEIDLNNLLSAAVGAAVGGLVGALRTNRKNATEREIDRLTLQKLRATVADLTDERDIYKPDFEQEKPDTPIRRVNIRKYDRRSNTDHYDISDDLTSAEVKFLDSLKNIDKY